MSAMPRIATGRHPGPQLSPEQIIATVSALRTRIHERFPGSGLERLSTDLLRIAEATGEQLRWVARPHLPLRVGGWAAIALLAAALVPLLLRIDTPARGLSIVELLQTTESAINDVILLGAAVYFLASAEARVKRRRALRFIRDLRAVAHIVDMHQLTKDPGTLVNVGSDTPSSPRRTLTRYELSRYLDYCSEMLALNSKLAALYAQNFDDPVVLAAVDEVETLTTGLSAKVWQKMVILNTPTAE
ncbi:MAG TPA: hypothetical protein VF710_08855 [Longimicrobium sp.]